MTYLNQEVFLEALGVPTANTVQFTDRACGSGKTSELLKSFKRNDKYFVVVPTRAEIDRVISDAVVSFDTPDEGSYQDEGGVKRSSLLMGLSELIEDGENIVCTHALFDKVNINEFALDDYNVIIDEVFDCVKGFSGPSDKLFEEHWVANGYATLDQTGKVIPTDKWLSEGDEGFKHKLLPDAKRGRLHRSGNGFFVTVVPVELFTSNRSCTVMTYLAEGSLMAMYLRKLGVPYEISKFDAIGSVVDHLKDLKILKSSGARIEWDGKNLYRDDIVKRIETSGDLEQLYKLLPGWSDELHSNPTTINWNTV
ncbi:MAG TPA: hypothetical protein DCE52_16395 [Rhodobacteraceae bacterium]|nr:hypothetical protein [Paracoccaceae bacterium]